MPIATVTGQISPADLGSTLMHEHLFINMKKEYREFGQRSNIDDVLHDVAEFHRHGGGTIVDVTTAEITHGTFAGIHPDAELARPYQKAEGARSIANIEMLQQVSRATGVNVIAGTGHYRDPYIDKDWFDETSTDRIAELMVRDIVEGIPGTTAKAGIIGEIGCDKWYLSAAEERSFRAAARAQLQTGIPLSTHAAFWPTGPFQVGLLTSEGVAPERIIVGHVDSVPDLDYPLAVARLGVWVQLDTFFMGVVNGVPRPEAIDARVDMLQRLFDAGFGDRVLVSHDVYLSHHSSANGGSGLSVIQTTLRQRMLERGFSESDFEQITVTNPASVFSS